MIHPEFLQKNIQSCTSFIFQLPLAEAITQKYVNHNTKINIDKSNHQRYKKGLTWFDFSATRLKRDNFSPADHAYQGYPSYLFCRLSQLRWVADFSMRICILFKFQGGF